MSDKPKVRLSAKGIPVGKMGRFKRRERFDLLASWYGSERAAVEISSHTCQPVAIKNLVNEVMLEPGRRNNSNIIAGLQSQWKQLVGGCFAAYTAPKSLRDGKLTIEVRHSALIAELSPSKDLFIKAVNKLSENLCTEVVFIIGSKR
ncbi:MAG: DUF721 domain-containing protein [Lentisphaerae bacterium]|nr:DUF721 domain-containing protein [Lentisphaerota bacterium]